ncbi:MAG: TDP-N-acetylfucosamine:lipid II N-acetylfucosaminyltransferase [Rhodocyclales bacterium]|nr:TDP-N-acetylfucosamine:lipid II N-acetylfucosaminyltransferase [Rhodocyclales bacterium]
MNSETTATRKIAHIILDEKFIDMAYREFEAVAPGKNILVMLGRPRPLRHVRSTDIMFLSVRRARHLVQSEECGAVVFHSLADEMLPLIRHIPPAKKVIWLGWGYDYYGRLLAGAYPEGLLLPLSRQLLENAPRPGRVRALASACERWINLALGNSVRYHSTLLRRVDYFAPVIDSEYRLACQLNPWFRPACASWNYGTVESDMGGAQPTEDPLGGNILIGNSATIENNHLEIFELLLRHVDLSGRQIIVPLSYGDDWYRDRIVASGQHLFGDRFVPLTSFMDRQAYVEVLHGCGHVFMNHLRQQALGNICIMMLKGARIYMNPLSPLYSWLTDKGGVISSVAELESAACGAKVGLMPLDERERAINAAVVKGHWGQEIQRTRTRRLVEVALGMDERPVQ